QLAPYPIQLAPYPNQLAPYPNQLAPYPNQLAPYLSQFAPYPNKIAPISNNQQDNFLKPMATSRITVPPASHQLSLPRHPQSNAQGDNLGHVRAMLYGHSLEPAFGR
ncbi:MAG: hypothetical protein WCL14_04255, partial [Bacteroidota bacterium]